MVLALNEDPDALMARSSGEAKRAPDGEDQLETGNSSVKPGIRAVDHQAYLTQQ